MLGQRLSVNVGAVPRSGIVKKNLGPNRFVLEYETANEECEVKTEEIDLCRVKNEWAVKGREFHRAALPDHIRLDKNIAFAHPIIPGLPVFIWQDMSHVMKRIVNALEFSNPGNGHKRNLTRLISGTAPGSQRREVLCLSLIHDCWLALGGGGVSQLRFGKLTVAHFEKNCFTRMRVFLAVQILSESVAQMIEHVMKTKEVTVAGKECFQSTVLFCRKMNRLIDIMNAADEKDAQMVRTPHDAILYEALEILGWLADWHHGLVVGGLDPEIHFFPSELWGDMQGMVLLLVCTARYFTSSFPNVALGQRRAQQGIVEHHFGHLRQAAGAARGLGAQQARSGTATSAAVRIAGNGNSSMGSDMLVDNSAVL